MKNKLLMMIIPIIIMSVIAIAVFGLAMLTFNFDRNLDDDLPSEIQEFVFSSDIEKLLILKQIEYSDNLVVTRGPAFAGDPGCGAVIDTDSQTHWFEIDSVSNPAKMTVYSENPHPCKINHTSCFCNAQMELVAATLEKLSYLAPEEEKQVGKRVQKYLETMPHQIPLKKFVVGKYNFDLGEKYTEICGAIISESDSGDMIRDKVSVYSYFSGAIDGPRLWDFALSVDNEKLCAISDDAEIFEYEKSGE